MKWNSDTAIISLLLRRECARLIPSRNLPELVFVVVVFGLCIQCRTITIRNYLLVFSATNRSNCLLFFGFSWLFQQTEQSFAVLIRRGRITLRWWNREPEIHNQLCIIFNLKVFDCHLLWSMAWPEQLSKSHS